MKTNSLIMLEALLYTPNPATTQHVKDLLAGRRPAWYKGDLTVEELATLGHLGDFLKAVMTGDLRGAWRSADELNKQALEPVILDPFR